MSYQVVSIPFGGGVDTKTDPKMTNPNKLTLLQDCLFTNFKRISKRNGYNPMTTAIVGGGNISSPTMCRTYKNELVVSGTSSGNSISGQRLFSYAPDLDAWADRGKYTSVEVSKQLIAQVDQVNTVEGNQVSGGTLYSTSAVIGSIAMFSYYNTVTNDVRISVVDQSTGVFLASNLFISGGSVQPQFPKAIILGGSTFAVISVQAPNFTYQINVITVTEAGGVVVGPTQIIASVFSATGNYDAIGTSSGAAMFFYNFASSNFQLYVLNSSGATVSSLFFSSGAFPNTGTAQVISLDAAGNFWIYWWYETVGAFGLAYTIYSPSLVQILPPTNIAVLPGPFGTVEPSLITSISNSGTTQQVYYSYQTDFGAAYYADYTNLKLQVVSLSGVVGAVQAVLNNVNIYSRPIQFNSSTYMAVVFISTSNPVGFLIDLEDPNYTAVAKFLPGQAQGLISNGGLNTINTLGSFSINSLVALTPTELFLSSQDIISVETQPGVPGSNGTAPSSVPFFVIQGTVAITFDFDSQDAYQSLVQQDTLVLNGGIVSQYDSVQVSELGFSVYPDGINGTLTESGSTTQQNWVYYFTYEWIDGQGNLHQSAPSIAYLVASTGITNSVVFTVQTLTMTQKTNVWIVMWRTESDGQIAYRLFGTLNNPSVPFVTMTDNFTVNDSQLLSFPSLYTQGGAILDNLPPPPAMILWTNNNRVWCVDSENPETTIEYSKTASPGSGIAFSTGLLEYLIDTRFGNITGVSPMDEKTVVLKQNGAFYFIGDGANDAGSGSTLSNPQVVPSDSGCSNSKSVILFPGGVLFRASNNKGIYIFSRSVQIQYFGLDVDKYADQDITAASYDGNRNQIRFLTSSGVALLYDYVMQQWSVFTNHQGYSADISPASVGGGVYTYVRTDGAIYQEDESGTYLDNTTPISPIVQMPWIKGSDYQGFQRTRRAMLLGDYTGANGHGVSISAAYDFDDSAFNAAVPYYFDGLKSFYQYRERFARAKCDAIQLQIQEITTGAAGEYIDFSDLGLEVQGKMGLNKLPASRSVG